MTTGNDQGTFEVLVYETIALSSLVQGSVQEQADRYATNLRIQVVDFWLEHAPWGTGRKVGDWQRACFWSTVVLCQVKATGRIVGAARMVTDRALRAWIEDVVVHPNYRRRGIGRGLVERLERAAGSVEVIELRTQEIPFWKALGYIALSEYADNAETMLKRQVPRG